MNKSLLCSVIFIVTVIGVAIIRKSFLVKVSAYSIAIITPISHPSLEKIEQGFIETFDKLTRTKNSYKIYNAQGKKPLLRTLAERAINSSYDLIFTIAAGPSLMTNEIGRKRGSNIPQIFSAVSHPMDYGIVQNRMITGVAEVYNPTLQIDALRYFKPSAEHVLIVYDPHETPALQSDAENVRRILESYLIKTSKLEISNILELAQRVAPFLHKIDTILVLIDNTVVAGIDVLITLCDRYGITLVTSDLNSGLKGASLSTGVKEEMYGIKAAYQANEVLVHHKNILTIPYVFLDDHYVQINTEKMSKQNLPAEKKLLSLPKVSQEKGCICVNLS